jgi:hypothetical protein
MRLPTWHAVSSVFVVGALTLLTGAGSAETRLTRLTTPPAVPVTGISVTMYCEQDSILCQAVASGGGGSYNFVWTNANEGLTEGNSSEAAPQCWSGHNKFTVSVSVTDGLGGSGSASNYFVCP